MLDTATAPSGSAAKGRSRREQLLAVAGRLFAERGYKSTTVRDIADAAGILSGSLYHHFHSKEAMVDEILRGFLDDLFGRYRAVVAQDLPPAITMERCVVASFEAIDRYTDAVAIYQTEARYLAQSPRFAYIADLHREFRDMWRGVLTAGVTDGSFRTDLDIEVTYRFLRDTVWVAVGWYRPGGALAADDVAQQYLTILSNGIVAH